MKILGKRDMILAAAILLIAAAVFGFNYVSYRTPAATAQISVDGKVVEILDLSKDTELTVTSPRRRHQPSHCKRRGNLVQ